ncbi:MAG TPA: fatty acid desaturase family protein [Pyrinomonadaceae bacterium]
MNGVPSLSSLSSSTTTTDEVNNRRQEKEVERYRFNSEILKRVRECRHNDNYHGVIEWAQDWLVIALSTYASLSAFRYLAWPLALPIYLFAIFLIGGRQRALADILHQAAHGTLLKNRRAADFFGTVLSGYLVLQSLSGYRFSHVVRHHGFLGDTTLDPDYEQYREWKICGANLTAAAVRRHLLRTLTPASTLNYIKYLLKHRIFPQTENSRERVFRISFVAIVTILICSFGYAHLLLFYWLIPLVTTQAWIGAFLELVEHYPMIETQRTFDIYMSRNRRCSWLSSFLLGLKQYDGYHLVHHTFPFIPSWRLPEAHRIMVEDANYNSMNQVYGWKGMLQTILNPERSSSFKLDSVGDLEVYQ